MTDNNNTQVARPISLNTIVSKLQDRGHLGLLPKMEEVRKGKGVVKRQSFSYSGHGGAASIKAELKRKDPTLKGKALANKVNEVLRGERDLREQLSYAFVAYCHREGNIAEYGDIGKNGATLKFKKLAKEPVIIAAKPATPEEIKIQIEKLQAELAKMNGATEAGRIDPTK